MHTQSPSDDSRIPFEDVGAAIREGRNLRAAHFYRQSCSMSSSRNVIWT